MEEIRILNAFVTELDIDKALSLLTQEIAESGMICGTDLFSMIVKIKILTFTEEPATSFSHHLDKLIEKGYRFNVHSANGLKAFAKALGVSFSDKCMRYIGYDRSDVLAMLYSVLNRAQLEPFFTMHTMPKMEEFLEFYPKEEAEKHFKSFLAMQKAREKVRKAAIVLIKVADRNTKAVMRIIARVVWSERGEEGWY